MSIENKIKHLYDSRGNIVKSYSTDLTLHVFNDEELKEHAKGVFGEAQKLMAEQQQQTNIPVPTFYSSDEIEDPAKVRRELDRLIYGQPTFKNDLAGLLQNHCDFLTGEVRGSPKSSMIIFGSEGTGKSKIAEDFSILQGLPFVNINLRSYNPNEGSFLDFLNNKSYEGLIKESIPLTVNGVGQKYPTKFEDNSDSAVIYIENLECLADDFTSQERNWNTSQAEAIQHQLVNFIDNTQPLYDNVLDTSRFVFLMGVSSKRLEKIIARDITGKGRPCMRPKGQFPLAEEYDSFDPFKFVTKERLHEFGFIPKLVRTISHQSRTTNFNEEMFNKIMGNKNSYIGQSTNALRDKGIYLKFGPGAKKEFLTYLVERGTNGGALKDAWQKMTQPYQLDVEKYQGKQTLDKETVIKRLKNSL